MSPMNQIAGLLLGSFVSIYLLLLWLRFMMQLVQADFYNPVAQAVVRFTDPVLAPIRGSLPKSRYYDFSALIVIVLLALLSETLMSLIRSGVTLPPLVLLFKTLFGLIWKVTDFFFWLLVISVVLSWISPGYNPATVMIRQLAEPVLAPFRRILPAMGGLDLSPILAFLTIQVLQILLSWAAGSLMQFF